MKPDFVHLSDLPAVPLRRRRTHRISQADLVRDEPPVPSFLDTARLDDARERLRRAIPPLDERDS